MDFLNLAYNEAIKARNIDEVPVGAVIVKNGKVIAKAYNKKESNNDPTGHAEILAIKKACKKLGNWRLIDCDIYISLEPCLMCLGAVIHSRIKRIYFGAIDNKSGSLGGAFNALNCGKFNHMPEYQYVENKECSEILKDYFRDKRNKKI